MLEKIKKKIAKKFKKLKIYHYGIISRENRLEKAQKERKQKLSFRSIPLRPGIENSEKITKKIQKIKQHHQSFFASQNRFGKAEKERKQKLSFRSFPIRLVIENSKKNSKKIQKIIIHHQGFSSSQKNCKKNSKNYKTPFGLLFQSKQVEKGREREKIKIIVPINSNLTCNRKFQKKNSKKIQKIIIHHQGLSSSQNMWATAEKE